MKKVVKQRTEQEWLALFEKAKSSDLSNKEFCKKNDIKISTFYTKRQKLLSSPLCVESPFVKAEIIQENTPEPVSSCASAKRVLSIKDIQLAIPPGISAAFIAELIGALR